VGRAKRRRIEFQSGQEHKWQTCDSSYEPLWLSLLRYLLHTMKVKVVVPLCGLSSFLCPSVHCSCGRESSSVCHLAQCVVASVRLQCSSLFFFISILLQSEACALAARGSSTSWSYYIQSKFNRDSQQTIRRHF
jgi:hypothetical protein